MNDSFGFSPMRSRRARLVVAALLALAAGLGCRRGGDPSGASTLPDDAVRDVRPSREPCEGTGDSEHAVDVNNDGRPDIRHVYRGGSRHCSVLDMNFDGRVDVTRFYEADGERARREEHDFDFDGRIDQISYYENGARVREELDTNFDERIDTWLWCENGRVVRAERDRFNRGGVDTWESYTRGVLESARYDEDRDGRPEKFEIFRDGRLIAYGIDTNGDGEPDRREEVDAETAGPAEDPLYCDRGLAEAANRAEADAAAAERAATPSSAPDGGLSVDVPRGEPVTASDAGTAPWDTLAPLGPDAGLRGSVDAGVPDGGTR